MKKLIFAILFCLISASLYSQWIHCNGINGGFIGANIYKFNNHTYNSINYTYAGTDFGLFVSTNFGTNWTQTSLNNQKVISVYNSGTGVFAGTMINGLFLSRNLGSTWEQTPVPGNVRCIDWSSWNIYVGTADGIYRSTDFATTWSGKLFNGDVNYIKQENPNVYAGFGYWGGIRVSTNYGINWSNFTLDSLYITCMHIYNYNNIIAGTKYYGVYRSTNLGNTWISSLQKEISSIVQFVDTLFVGTKTGIYKSTNLGINWTQTSINSDTVNTLSYDIDNNYIFAGVNNNKYYVSSNGGVNWKKDSINSGVQSVEALSLIESGGKVFAGVPGRGIYYSTNNGADWIQSSLNNLTVTSFTLNGGNIYAGTTNNGLYYSSNNGNSWIPSSLNTGTVLSLMTKNNSIYAGTNNGILKSTNNGTNWFQTFITNDSVYALTSTGNYIFAATNNGLRRSSNEGVNWSLVHNIYIRYMSLTCKGTYVFVGTSNGIYVSPDNGSTWNPSYTGSIPIYAMTTYGNNVIAGTNNGVLLTTNNGTNWLNKNQGFSLPPSVKSFFVSNNYIYAGTSYSIWRRLLNDIIYVNLISEYIPSTYKLEQNYPNPFNPTTNIRYQIQKSGTVKISVYDMLGKEIETLVNEKQSPGTYEVSWNGSKYPSGVYYYKINSDDYTETKKMLMIK